MEQDQQEGRKSKEAQRIDEFLFTPFSSEGRAGADEIVLFQERIYHYYRSCARVFPWRETTDAYLILVSEMMLQQTQASRVLPKYMEFVSCFPDIPSLADASLAQIFSLWQGLGYNRRAKALQSSARMCMEEFDGKVPGNEPQLRRLPMVGPATAAAVMAFAYRKPSLYLETNIRRVLLYSFFSQMEHVHDARLYEMLKLLLDRRDPKRWYYALMDYGVFLKSVIPNPNTRSAHYSRQGAFENSNRQVRGAILLLLNEKGPSQIDEIISLLPFDKERLLRALGELEREGLAWVSSPSPGYGEEDLNRKVEIPR